MTVRDAIEAMLTTEVRPRPVQPPVISPKPIAITTLGMNKSQVRAVTQMQRRITTLEIEVNRLQSTNSRLLQLIGEVQRVTARLRNAAKESARYAITLSSGAERIEHKMWARAGLNLADALELLLAEYTNANLTRRDRIPIMDQDTGRRK